MHTAQGEKPFPNKLCSFMSNLCAYPASSALVPNQEKFRCREGRKIGQNIPIVES